MADDPLEWRSLSDVALIGESLSRPELFSAIFERHFAAIYGYLARRAGRDVSEDLTSTTFAVAFERRSTFIVGSDSARPWLFGIATHLLYNRMRGERRLVQATSRLRGELAAGREGSFGDPALAADGVEDPSLARSLEALDASQRDVLLLYAWGELSYEEIALALDVPVGTVRSRLSRARARLRAELADPGGVPVAEASALDLSGPAPGTPDSVD